MRVLSVGPMSGLSNTCLQRHWAIERVAGEVDQVNTSRTGGLSLCYRIAYHLFWWLRLPVPLPESQGENARIRQWVDSKTYDVVWIDKGITISPHTLRYIKRKQPQCRIVSYSPDNMALRHNQSQQYLQCIPLYDLMLTNKSYILDAMRALGARDICFVDNCFEPTFHHPRELTAEEQERLGSEVGFVGAWEQERCASLLFLAAHGLKVKVWGDGKWNDYRGTPNMEIGPGLYSDDYPKALQAARISLCFLRKINFDQQTTRTMEIPACGGFMMAERTPEHERLFADGKEAVFFSSNEELLQKCRYYLAHESERQAIARAGRARCLASDYTTEGMVRRALQKICPARAKEIAAQAQTQTSSHG